MKVDASAGGTVRSTTAANTPGCGSAGDASEPVPNDPERLIIIARELTRGGAAYLALRHARQLSRFYRVDVLVTGPCDANFVAEFPAEIEVFRLGTSRPFVGSSWLHALRRFAEDHREEAPFRRHYQAALGTSTFPDLAACAAVCTVSAAWRLVFLVDESLLWYPELNPPARGIFERCILGADLVLPVSRRLWAKMAAHCPPLQLRPWRALPPPIERDRIVERSIEPQTLVVPGSVPNVLTIARLSPEKQIERCVHVHHRLKQAGVRFRWHVIGTGPDEPQVRAAIRELAMEDDFRLAGHQANVYSSLGACDLFALFSKSEGCPTVVREALALGRPVIMTDVNGCDELIEHESTGLIVANTPEAIAGGLARMVGDATLRQEFQARITARGVACGGREPVQALPSLVLDLGPRPGSPRVTILIPTYNQAAVLDHAIQSALEQDQPSLEVIVLDDASTDETELTARAWEFDPRFRYVRNERNVGRVENYRRGVTEHARGEWVLMLDGDDYLTDPEFIRRACEAIDRHADGPVAFVQAGHRVRHLDGRWDDVDVVPPIDGPERVLAGGEYLRFVFATGFFTHLGALFNRRWAIDIGGYTAEISSSDMDTLLRLALEGNVVLLNQVAGCWIQHGANTSARLGLDDVAPNVRIFRQIAREAVGRGLATWVELDGPLTNYEARTLVYLFDTILPRSAGKRAALMRFLAIALTINPRLAVAPPFRAACRRYFQTIIAPSLERGQPGRLALWVLRRLRATWRWLAAAPAAGVPSGTRTPDARDRLRSVRASLFAGTHSRLRARSGRRPR